MSSTDMGRQILTFDYKQQGTSQGFNRLFYDVLSTGIYSGGEITINAGASISIAPFVSLVRDDGSSKVAVRVETQDSITITNNVDNAHPYVIGVFSWQNTENNFMEIKCVSYAEMSSTPNILIFGRCVYEGSTLQRIDTTRRTIAQISKQGCLKTDYDFNVSIDENNTNSIVIGSGKAYIGGKYVNFLQHTNVPITVSVTNKKIDLVSIDRDGNVVITESDDDIDAVAPLFPTDMLTVAVITIPSSANVNHLDGSMIENVYVNNVVQNSSSVNTFTVLDSTQTITPSSNEHYCIDETDITVTLNSPLNNRIGCEVEFLFKKNAYITYETTNYSTATEYITKNRNLTFVFNGVGWIYTPEDTTKTITARCSTALGQDKTLNIPYVTLSDNLTIEVLFSNGHYVATSSDAMTLNVNSLGAKKIYSVRDGTPIVMPNHSCTRDESGDSTAHYWVIQANTFLKLMYDSTLDSGNGGWLVLGNPIVLSYSSANESYTIYSDGWIKTFVFKTRGTSDINTVTFPIPYSEQPHMTSTQWGNVAENPRYDSFGTSVTTTYLKVRIGSATRFFEALLEGY